MKKIGSIDPLNNFQENTLKLKMTLILGVLMRSLIQHMPIDFVQYTLFYMNFLKKHHNYFFDILIFQYLIHPYMGILMPYPPIFHSKSMQ